MFDVMITGGVLRESDNSRGDRKSPKDHWSGPVECVPETQRQVDLTGVSLAVVDPLRLLTHKRRDMKTHSHTC